MALAFCAVTAYTDEVENKTIDLSGKKFEIFEGVDSGDEMNLLKNNLSFLGLFLGGVLLMQPELSEAQQKRLQNGGRGPGGGDVMLCKSNPQNRFDGIYSYDYVQTRKSLKEENSDEYEFAAEATCLDRLKAIEKKLQSINPILASGLNEYIGSLPLQARPKKSVLRRWEPISYQQGPIECSGHDIQDETRIISTPNCVQCQMFIRDFSKTNAELIYTYDARLLTELKQAPKQCSYAFIHEWARDFLPDSKDLYFFTRMLHSDAFHKDGVMDYSSIPRTISDCLKQMADEPINMNTIDQYFAIVSQVPPTPQELESYHQEMKLRFNELNASLENRLKNLAAAPPIGYSEARVKSMIHIATEMKETIERDLRNGVISHNEAFVKLTELEVRIPAAKPNPLADPFFSGMLFVPPAAGEIQRFQIPPESKTWSLDSIEIITPAKP